MDHGCAQGWSSSIFKPPAPQAPRSEPEEAPTELAAAATPPLLEQAAAPRLSQPALEQLPGGADGQQQERRQQEGALQGPPLSLQQLDEEMQPLRQRQAQREKQLAAAKRQQQPHNLQQQPQRVTPAKVPRLPLTPSPARQQRPLPDPSAGSSIADLQRFTFDASKQQRSPAGATPTAWAFSSPSASQQHGSS